MKKFMKTCGVIALILLGCGGAMLIAGCALAGTDGIRQAVDKATDGKVQVTIDSIGDGISSAFGGFKENVDSIMEEEIYSVEDYGISYDDSKEILTGNVEKGRIKCGDISALRVEAGGCDFRIEESQDDGFWIEAENVDKLQAYSEGDALRIISNRSGKVVNEDIKRVRVILYVPADYAFDSAILELGAGNLSASELNAGTAELNVGAGHIALENLKSENTILGIGAGGIEIKKIQTGELSCDAGAGGAEIRGSVDGDCNITCAVGGVSLVLENDEKEFDYRLDCTMGHISLGKHEYTGLAREKKIDNDGDKKMELNCSLGNISVKFE
ncbi:MAG: DUF4097 family beta strand repeat protein [Lachnospiraceae bacterium]|nr:DUF4097 family beta strand repeat protein [Lachnospiraceae bacterium]